MPSYVFAINRMRLAPVAFLLACMSWTAPIVEAVRDVDASVIWESGQTFDQYPAGAVRMSGSGADALIFMGVDARARANFTHGAVQIFSQLSNGSWALQSVLSNPVPEHYANFGAGLAVNPQGTLLLVGAPYAPVNGNVEQGLVYVFSRATPESAWNSVMSIILADGQTFDGFGSVIELSEDGTLALIAALGRTGPSKEQGIITVVSLDIEAASYSVLQQLTSNTSRDYYGGSIALSQGKLRFAVTATDLTSGGNTRTFVYERSNTSTLFAFAIDFNDADVAKPYRTYVPVSVNSDGTMVVVGVPDAESGSGKVIFYWFQGGEWQLWSTLQPQNAATYSAQFGSSLSLSDDGLSMFIGASGLLSSSGSYTGTVTGYSRMGNIWVPYTVTSPVGVSSSSAGFGKSLAVSTDFKTLASLAWAETPVDGCALLVATL